MDEQYYQGDVLLRRAELPKTRLRKINPNPTNKYVLAEGEASGTAHTIDSKITELFMDGEGRRWLVVERPSAILHEAKKKESIHHSPLEIPAGTYEVVVQREYHPQEFHRRVLD